MSAELAPASAQAPPARRGAADTRRSAGAIGRAAATGAAWTGLLTTGSNAIAFGVFVVLGRVLAPAQFGLVGAAMVVVLLLRILVDAGFSQLLVQRTEITPELVDTAFWSAIALGVLLAAVMIAAAPLFALLFSQPHLTNVVRVLSVILLFVALDSTQSALADRQMQFRMQAIRRLTGALVSAGVAVALALSGAGVWALVGQQVVLEGVTAVMLWALVPWRPSLRFVTTYVPELIRFGRHYLGVRLLNYLQISSDNFIIGLVLGAVALGYYVVAYRVLVVLNEVITLTIARVALTTFSRLRGDRETLNAAFYRANHLTAVVGFPIYAGLALVAHPMMAVVFGSKWTPSAGVLQALTLAGLVQCQTTFSQSYAIALGRVGNEMRWSAFVVALELIGFAVAVNFGMVAVALSLGLVLLATWPIRLIYMKSWSELRLGPYFAGYPAILAATVLMAGVVIVLGAALSGLPRPASLTVQVLGGMLTYILAFGLMAPAEVRALRRMVGQLGH